MLKNLVHLFIGSPSLTGSGGFLAITVGDGTAGKIFLGDACGNLAAVGGLIEGTVKGRDEEHKHLGAHTHEESDVSSRQVCKLEESTENHH